MTLWGLDWGDVPTWIAAVFGGGAFAGALLLFRIEALRDRERYAEDRKRQASAITAWISSSDDDERPLKLNMLNGSPSVIYDVWVVYEAWGRVLDYEAFDALPPAPGGNRDNSSLLSTKTFDEYGVGLAQASVNNWDNIRAVLYFRDSANVCWKRDRHGHLIEIQGGEWVPQEVLVEHERRSRVKYEAIFPSPED